MKNLNRLVKLKKIERLKQYINYEFFKFSRIIAKCNKRAGELIENDIAARFYLS
jgi:predicted component of type VI protein secretion system